MRGVKGINSSAVMTGGIVGLVDATRRDVAGDWITAGTPTPQILLHSLAEWNSPGCLGHPCVIVQNFGGPLQGHAAPLVVLERHTPFATRSAALHQAILVQALVLALSTLFGLLRGARIRTVLLLLLVPTLVLLGLPLALLRVCCPNLGEKGLGEQQVVLVELGHP